MSKEKQIEEMAKDVWKASCTGHDIGCTKCDYANNGTDKYSCVDYVISQNLYNAGYRKQEWISVDERLPEQANHYLTVSEEGIYVRFYSSEWGWNYDFGEVTHWMPLPEAPKMKGGAEQ